MGGKRIAEFPNSTAFDLAGRAFVIPRAVPPYENTINPKAGIFNSPSGYISHLPMLEEHADGTYAFHGWMLESIPGELVFEDPRISTLYREEGEPYILLSFTEVLPKEGQIRNRAVILEVGPDGVPRMPEPGAEQLEAAAVLALQQLSTAHPGEELGEVLEKLASALLGAEAAADLRERSPALGWKLGDLALGKRAAQLSTLALAMPRGSPVEDRAQLLLEASPECPTALVEALAAALGKIRLPERINYSPSGIDAKNGTLDENEAGEIVLRTRMRGFPLCPGYAEQVWVFKDWDHFVEYQRGWNGWEQALEEGHRNGGPIDQVPGQVRPLRAKIIATEETFPEFYPRELLSRGEPAEEGGPEKHFRGFGPGTRPVRFERQGNDLYFSGGRHDQLSWAGEIPENLRRGFPIPAGEVRRLPFDHQLRALDVPVYRTLRSQLGMAVELQGAAVPRRMYPGCAKLLSASGDAIELLYCDLVQPLNASARGGGIADLEHVYPEGWRVKQGAADGTPPMSRPGEEQRYALSRAKGRATLLVYQGEADASTGILEFDPIQLLGEMGAESPRRLGSPGEQQVGPPLEVSVPRG